MIIPAYNEERRLPPSLEKVAAFLRAQPYRSEVIVVENGSTDRTAAVVEEFAANVVQPGDPFIIDVQRSAPGKGAAVKHGMLMARGEFLFICDADLAMPIEEISKFLPPAIKQGSYDIAIASREVKGAVRYNEPAYRHIMGRVFNMLVRVLAVPGIQDTQCGFKMFTRNAALQAFPLQQLTGWSFDVEVLYIARQHDMRLVEVPIQWYYQTDSRVRPVQDTINMVRELLKIRHNGRDGLYAELAPYPTTLDEASVV
ncbi:MAG: glycosyltransferase family 2 protein [Anaerolineales bacterium]|nr:glycosyltransferase family 2 protein [Anaerolineales bacterium]